MCLITGNVTEKIPTLCFLLKHLFSHAVLHTSEGLVAVWFLLLCATGVHSCVLHSDDMRDAQPQERQPAHSSHRAPQTGLGQKVAEIYFLRNTVLLHCGTQAP